LDTGKLSSGSEERSSAELCWRCPKWCLTNRPSLHWNISRPSSAWSIPVPTRPIRPRSAGHGRSNAATDYPDFVRAVLR